MTDEIQIRASFDSLDRVQIHYTAWGVMGTVLFEGPTNALIDRGFARLYERIGNIKDRKGKIRFGLHTEIRDKVKAAVVTLGVKERLLEDTRHGC